MKTAPGISLLLATLLGFASPAFGQGSMSRFTSAAQNTVGRDKAISAPPTKGFTISAQRDFDHSVAITVSSATRYWFQEFSAPSEVLVATGRYENATLWAQATPVSHGLAFAGNGRNPRYLSGSITVMAREYSPGYPNNRVGAGDSPNDETQLAAWIQSNIRFANADPTKRR